MDYFDPENIKRKIDNYFRLEEELKGIPINELESYNKSREFLNIGYFLGNLVLKGHEIIELIENYSKEEDGLENRLNSAEKVITSIKRLVHGKEGENLLTV